MVILLIRHLLLILSSSSSHHVTDKRWWWLLLLLLELLSSGGGDSLGKVLVLILWWERCLWCGWTRSHQQSIRIFEATLVNGNLLSEHIIAAVATGILPLFISTASSLLMIHLYRTCPYILTIIAKWYFIETPWQRWTLVVSSIINYLDLAILMLRIFTTITLYAHIRIEIVVDTIFNTLTWTIHILIRLINLLLHRFHYRHYHVLCVIIWGVLTRVMLWVVMMAADDALEFLGGWWWQIKQ